MPGAAPLRDSLRLAPCRPAAAGWRRRLVARAAPAPDDPHLQQAADEEEGHSSGDEEFDTIAGAVEVVDEDEAEVGAGARGGGWRRPRSITEPRLLPAVPLCTPRC